MSLINQMLKDLEQRRSNRAHNAYTFTNPTAPVSSNRHYARLIYFSIIIFLLILFAVFFFARKLTSEQPIKTLPQPITKTAGFVKPLMTPNKQVAVTIAAAQPKTTVTTLVRAIALTGDTQNTRLTLFLNTPAHYTVSNDPSQNNLTLTLADSQLAEPLLPINTKNTLLKNLAVNSNNNQLQLIMSVLPGAQIAQIHMENTANPALILDLTLENNTDNSPVVSNTVATVNPANLSPSVLTAAGLNTNTEPSSQSYVEKIPEPLTAQQLAERDYETALNLIQSNRLPDAVNLLQQILLRSPDNTPARTTLAGLYLKQNQLDAAEKTITAGLAIQPKNSILTKLFAQILLTQNKPEQALAVLKTTTPTLINDPDYYALMAALYQKEGYYLKAAQIYDQLTNLNPNNSIWWLGLATSLEAAGKNKAALQAYFNCKTTNNLTPQLQTYVNNRIQALGAIS